MVGVNLLLAMMMWFVTPLPAAPPHSIFTDVTGPAGMGGVTLVSGSETKDYILETLGTGVAAFDYDNDGWQDLYLPNGSRIGGFEDGDQPLPRMFRNRGDGTFENVAEKAGLATPFWGFGVAVGDYDNDGFSDMYVTVYGPNRLYRNRGDGTFEEVGEAAGVADPRWGASTAFADFDNDGLLDIFVANYVAFDALKIPRRGDPSSPCFYRGAMVMCGPTGLKGEIDTLYHNNGDGTFTNVSASSGIRSDIGMFGLGVATADYDEDGDVDVYVANDATPNQLYRNRGDGTFDEVAPVSGVAYGTDGAEQGSMGTAFGDYDGDGHLDLVVTNFSHQFYQLFRYVGSGFFEDVTFSTGLAEASYLALGWGTGFLDYDNDGWLDLFFANGHVYPGADEMQIGTVYRQPNQLFRNVAAGPGRPDHVPEDTRVFVDVGAEAGEGFTTPRSYRTAGPVDYDGDGDLDMVITVMDGPAILLRNDLGAPGHWLELTLRGTASNRSGIGARVTGTAGGRPLMRYAGSGGSFQWSNDQRIHFGLGPAATIDSLEIVWPGGAKQRFAGVKADTGYVLIEGGRLEAYGPATRSGAGR